MSYAGFNVLTGSEYIGKVINELNMCNKGTQFLSHPNMVRPEIKDIMRSSLATHTFWDNPDLIQGLYDEAEKAWASTLKYDIDNLRTVLNWDSITEILSRFMEVYGAKLSIFTTDRHYIPSNLMRIYDDDEYIRYMTITNDTSEDIIDERITEAVSESNIILLRGLNYSTWTYQELSKKIDDIRNTLIDSGSVDNIPIIISDITTNVPFHISDDDISFEISENMYSDVCCFHCGGVLGGPDGYVTIINEQSRAILQDNESMYNDLLKYITTDNFDRYNLAIVAGKLLTAEYCTSIEFADSVEELISIRDDIEAQFARWKHSDMIVKCHPYTTDIVIDASKIAEPFTDDDEYKISSGELTINLSLYRDYNICEVGTPEDINKNRNLDNNSGLLLNIPSLLNVNYIQILQTLVEEFQNEYDGLYNQWVEECSVDANNSTDSTTNLLVEIATSFGEAVKEAGRTLISAFKPKRDNDNTKR